MATPEVTCGADVELSYSGTTQNANLSASATNSPTSYTWTILSAPNGSTALTSTKGDFVNGVATVQNPTFTTDAGIEGTYVIQCVATNSDGDSNPSLDKQGAQQNIVVKTQSLSMSLCNDYQYDWADYNNSNLSLLESAIISSIDSWNYLSTSNPSGVGVDPEIVYQFDKTANSLNDRTANGHDLSIASGSVLYTRHNGLYGFFFDDANAIDAPADSGYHFDREITVEVLLSFMGAPDPAERHIINCFSSAVTNPTSNELYQISVQSSKYRYFWEHGSGSNIGDSFDGGPITSVMHLVTMTRDSAGTGVKLYMDGYLIDEKTASTAPEKDPTPANNIQKLRLGGESETLQGSIFSVRVTGAEFTEGQVLAAYNAVKGKF